MRFTARNKAISNGFTLIELLIVIGILLLLLSITLIAINPFEQLSKTSDVATDAVAKDFASATKYYYAAEKTVPWRKNTTCRNELATGNTLTDAPTCVKEMIGTGQLQTGFLAAKEPKNIYITECNDGVALCFNAKSQAFSKDAEAKYTKNGVIQPGCPGGSDCYSCTFSTNQVEECLQALNPHGTLAVVPSPSPDAPLPIADRHAKPSCSTAVPGSAACMAEVVTDSGGTPLSSIALPAGFGPTQIHSAYNLPCTPGGGVQALCSQPASFGPKIIAVVLAYHAPTLESDLAVYNQTYGLPSCTIANGCLTIVNQNGAPSPLPGTDANWALESSLDVQMSHAVCQTCKILVVEANSNSFADLGVAVNRAATMGASSISNSYGASEWSGETSYDTYYTHPGTFVTASSGDSGYGASYPSSSKNVIAVGGTTLSLLNDNSYAAESVWSGTGSGCSLYQSASNFQTSLSNWNLTGCSTKRSNTDVSAVANPNTGVAIYDSTSYSGHTGWWILGGTSVSSPLVSAALAMQVNAPTGVDAATYLYANPTKFRDVTTGSNGSCGGTTACTSISGYDGPSGLGSPNFLPPSTVSPTSVVTPSPMPTPTTIPSPSPTQAAGGCTTVPTVTLGNTNPILALAGDTINNVLTVKNNDSLNCSSLFTISYGFPSGWVVNGIPPSFTLQGLSTQYMYFTIQVPSSATAGNYPYQFWAQKQGQSSAISVSGSVQVQQLGPTNTPTPTPVTCTHGWSQSLGSTSLSGNAGDTINQTLTITNNNPASCGSALFGISHAEPSGFTLLNLPPSVTVSGGQSTTIPFTITISTGAQIGDYITQYWVDSGALPSNATIHVLGTSQPPAQQMFSNFAAKMYGNYALIEFSYNQYGTGSFRMDVATDPSALNQTTGPNANGYYGFAYTTGNAMDASNTATPTSVRGFISSSPQSWAKYTCGSTIYYRLYNSGDLRIMSPVQSARVDCTTVVDVLPWSPWYAAIYQGVYDARYDADSNGIVDWNDYWILVRATRLR